ncbi:ATP-dependent nuclease [Hyphomicrobium sp. MC8b]|uniref:ATP-dependent nuclease n=1 Tax=Hyphomicrobium sp. MC8b TaxID=300273 RepID=UPI00391DD47B
MKIKRFKILNYSSFENSGWINLDPGINLFIGQNNSGKTALLRALSGLFDGNPHRTLENYLEVRLQSPLLYVDLELTGAELETAFLQGGQDVYWGPPDNALPIDQSAIFSFHLKRKPQNRLEHVDDNTRLLSRLRVSDGTLKFSGRYEKSQNANESISPYFDQKLFYFDSQRFSIGRCDVKENPYRLHFQTRNLPAVVNEMQGRYKDKFETLCRYLRSIFPTVHSISVSTAPGNQNEFVIWIWPTKNQSQPEFAFELNSCGTGVAQVIAILTVLLVLDNAVIVIDEISAFLHPLAIKSLLRIINSYYPEHQYLISGHSTDVLAHSSPSTVHLIRRHGFNSTVESLNLNEVASLRSAAQELGISMSDVFGADGIIWVEGPTEANCFPFIYTELIGEIPQGTTFSPVASTSDFSAKGVKASRIINIYETISKHTSPLINAIAFSLDREQLKPEQIIEIEKKANGRLLFLPRRCFECYLIDPDAICALITLHMPDLIGTITPEKVLEVLFKLGESSEFSSEKSWSEDIYDEVWLTQVDGARLIAKAITSLTDAKLSFDKVRDTITLSRHIVQHRPSAFNDLKSYLSKLMSKVCSE